MFRRDSLFLTLSLLTLAAPAYSETVSLQDLKGYQPPQMFGSVAKPVPVQPKFEREPEAVQQPLQKAPQSNSRVAALPRAEDILSFPVSDSGVVTRHITDAPEEKLSAARPDYSDSHTILHMTPVNKEKPSAVSPEQDKKKKIAKKAEKATKNKHAEMATASGKEGRYIPASQPSMPAVPAISVEKSGIDPFALPNPSAKKTETPTTTDILTDKALNRHLAQPDKKEIVASVADTAASREKPVAFERISMEFKPSLTNLQDDQKDVLKNEILSLLKKNDNNRIQIQAFASAPGEDGEARRISLSRALSVRSYLIDNGVEASRMDVKAMGSRTAEAPADRVDLVLTAQN